MPISSTTTVVAVGSTQWSTIGGSATQNNVVVATQNITNLLVDNGGQAAIHVAFRTGSNASALPSVTATSTSLVVPANSSRIIAGGKPNTGNGVYANVSISSPYGNSNYFLTPVA